MSTSHDYVSRDDSNQRVVELHDAPEHAHLVAENHREQHVTGSEISRRALEHTEDAHHAHAAITGHGVTAFGHEDIAVLAHKLWEARGCPVGSPDEDWFHAVKELRTRAIAGGRVYE
jgi:hypothetical protein